jgi:hypothetical protein
VLSKGRWAPVIRTGGPDDSLRRSGLAGSILYTRHISVGKTYEKKHVFNHHRDSGYEQTARKPAVVISCHTRSHRSQCLRRKGAGEMKGIERVGGSYSLGEVHLEKKITV